MAKQNLGARIGKSFTSRGINVRQNILKSQDISHVVKAINTARSVTRPDRRLLLDLFENILIDGHLDSVTDKRMKALSNKRIKYSLEDGKEDENMRDNVVQTPWFYDLTKAFSERPVWGATIAELIIKNGIISKTKKINRKLMIPEEGKLLWDENNREDFIYYEDDPSYSRTLLSFGGAEFGKLFKAAQYVIYKRGGFGDWAQFAEIFGMPFRIGKYEGWDQEGRKQLLTELENMGGAAYAAIPRQTDIEFKDSNSAGKSEVFHDLIEMCNSEMSKIFLGQTMTTDNGSSKSQSEVHKEVESEIILADMIEYEYHLNWEFKDKLVNLGINPPKGRFHFDETENLPIEKFIDVAIKVASKVPIEDAWWYKTFNCDPPKQAIKKTKEQTKKDDEDGGGDPKPEPEPENSLNPMNYILPPGTNIEMNYTPNQDENKLIDELFNGTAASYSPAVLSRWFQRLGGAIRSNLSVGTSYNEPDHISGLMLEMNMHRFGWNKSLGLIYELNQALDISENYSDFKKKALLVMGKFDSYLETEYNQAIAVSQNARRWNDIKANQETFPYWQYTTAGDSHVRSSHADLDGKVFSVSDKSAGSFVPPNGYGCRCSLRKLTKAQATKIGISKASDAIAAMGDEELSRMKKGGFYGNKGEANEIWRLNQAYVDQIPSNGKKPISKLTYQDAGLESSATLRKLQKNKLPKSEDTAQSILENFDKSAQEYNGQKRVLLKDYSGRNVAVSRNVLDDHLKGKYVNDNEERQRIYSNVKSILQNPDEVWLNEYKIGKFQYNFVKHYNDETMVVNAEISKYGFDLKTWYKGKMSQDSFRKGLVIKK
ncbi:MAG: hypothetical protein CL843_16370 [Crocinitomicaceae bacterium]|nr:hypothetical protein [Crocinitomicaceae bacterium]